MRIPRDFREAHALDVSSRYYSQGAVAGSRVYRAGGTCSCGVKFGLRNGSHSMDRGDVVSAHRAHVEQAWLRAHDAVKVVA